MNGMMEQKKKSTGGTKALFQVIGFIVIIIVATFVLKFILESLGLL